MKRLPTKVRIALAGVVVLALAATGGRLLIHSASTGSGTGSAASTASRVTNGSFGPAGHGGVPGEPSPAALAPQSAAGTATGAGSGSGSGSGLGSSPPTNATNTVEPVGPLVVRTASLSLKVGKGVVPSTMTKIASVAAFDGGYVQSSSMSGGSTRSAPTTGQIVIEVQSAELTSALSELSLLGNVTNEQTSGQDVTGQVAENAATIAVLQQEVNLLENELSKATDVSDFVQIEGQLAPVAQQLQQLQSQQSVLESSAELAAVTVDLNAPIVPIIPVSGPRPATNAAAASWHYLRHNTLVVLDGIAVAGGWALPLLVLAGAIWLVVSRIVRRRRPSVTPA